MEALNLDQTRPHINQNLTLSLGSTVIVDLSAKARIRVYDSPVFAKIEYVDRICSNLRARNITHDMRFEVGGYKFLVTLTVTTKTIYFWILE